MIHCYWGKNGNWTHLNSFADCHLNQPDLFPNIGFDFGYTYTTRMCNKLFTLFIKNHICPPCAVYSNHSFGRLMGYDPMTFRATIWRSTNWAIASILRGDCLATPLGSIQYRQKATPKNLTPDFYRRLLDPCNQAYFAHFLNLKLKFHLTFRCLGPGAYRLYGTLKWNTNPYYNLYCRLLC